MNKHAYLILAHRDDYTFYALLKLLDYEDNDIYIHMDAKNITFSEIHIKRILRKSDVFFTKRTNVSWGGYSQISAELLLLKCATEQKKYLYYHLLSGQDLPIQKQCDIHAYFKARQGIEFVRFESNEFRHFDRVKYYYLFQEIMGHKKSLVVRGITQIQKLLRIHRNKNILFQKGSNWFSITDDLARYVISKEKWIKKVFRYTICCDEVFLQTIIINSHFKKKLVKTDFDNDDHMFMRLIDWKRGNPYIFRIEYWKMIEQSDMLFARKFSAEVDRNVIQQIIAIYGIEK